MLVCEYSPSSCKVEKVSVQESQGEMSGHLSFQSLTYPPSMLSMLSLSLSLFPLSRLSTTLAYLHRNNGAQFDVCKPISQEVASHIGRVCDHLPPPREEDGEERTGKRKGKTTAKRGRGGEDGGERKGGRRWGREGERREIGIVHVRVEMEARVTAAML